VSAVRRAQLAKIHIGAKQLGLIDGEDRDTYEAMLYSVARVRSAADLDSAGRQRVISHLKRCGADFRRPKGKRKYTPGSQAALIRHLWERLHNAGEVRSNSDQALRRYVRNQTKSYHPDGVGYDSPELMPMPVASKVIEQMKRWCRRCGVELS